MAVAGVSGSEPAVDPQLNPVFAARRKGDLLWPGGRLVGRSYTMRESVRNPAVDLDWPAAGRRAFQLVIRSPSKSSSTGLRVP